MGRMAAKGWQQVRTLRCTLICLGILLFSELAVVPGTISLTGVSWYYRAPGWHMDLLRTMETTFAILTGVAWGVVLPFLVWRDMRGRKRKRQEWINLAGGSPGDHQKRKARK